MNIGDTIYQYKINLKISGQVEKYKTENKVIGLNDNYFCIDTLHFQTLQFKNEKYATCTPFDVVKVYESKWSSRYLEDEINGYIYTTESDEKKIYKRIKKEIEKYLKKEYGKYGLFIGLLDNIVI